MQVRFPSRVISRAVANARGIRQAPEAIILLIIVAVGAWGLQFQQYRELLADLNGRLVSQDRLLTEYRTKLTSVAAQVEKLTAALADAEKNLKAAKPTPTSAENRSRNPRSLYEDDNPVAQVQDPKIDIHQKRVIFLTVNSANLLQTDKLYEFQNWKLTCGGTRLFNMVTDRVSREFSYSPLTCKIVGDR
jgi:chromosome segregation ATPase